MGRRLIVDTNVLVAIERGSDTGLGLRDDDELAIAAITQAELRVGVLLAADADVAAARQQTVATMLDAVDVLDYTSRTADHHAELLAHTRRIGTPRGAHDLIIAAHAAETGRGILTRDVAARFGDLPGVRAG
ncbi:MAG TPA: PIN domain-containing protein [Candidatus Ruania gallistercoris]|uniref:Ribonuclease VapC n=1 Tax=Candidatus Ruania gallistercoris TaxID=2838746 RepID=A0A9D2EHB2_9MICO|nr:PIN domain-containing protein [Candidatus Ruania gallistercoris]